MTTTIDVLIELAFTTRDQILSIENQLADLIKNKIKLGNDKIEFSAQEINAFISQQNLVNNLQQDLLFDKANLIETEEKIRKVYDRANLKSYNVINAEIENQKFSCWFDEARKLVIQMH